VGKTYAMLVEARLRAGRGEDVVLGHLRPHLRPDIEELANGFERIAPESIEYHGGEFGELATDAIIARHPEWVVVDELAHTVVPGTRHDKRWEAVDEILDAGISVLSTLNIQHVESLVDFVYQVSGVRVTETVPDGFVEAAQLVLVDADPDELLARVRRGSVVPHDEIAQALAHYFRKSTLVALRERMLAMGGTAQVTAKAKPRGRKGHSLPWSGRKSRTEDEDR
jgi:two-component system sensor histidine kinase KdpD